VSSPVRSVTASRLFATSLYVRQIRFRKFSRLGSRRPRLGRKRWTSRFTVEECLALDVESLHRSGIFASAPGTIWKTVWETSWGGNKAELGYVVVLNPAGGLALWIDPEQANIHPALKLPGKYLVPIATIRPYLGGRRFLFQCPVLHDGKPCGRRVGRLYLPPGERFFACRKCHGLTYKSAQQHDQRKYDLARDPVALSALLDAALIGPNARRVRLALLGVGGLVLLRKWSRQGRMRQLARVSGLMP